jgi:putative DNA primase/helicase
MRRKKPDEKPERLRSDRVFEDFKHLRQKALRWTNDNIRRLTDSDPLIPSELNDRARDSWRPLLAIAELAGMKWAEYGRASAVKLCETKGETSKLALLLSDIRNIFKQAQVSRMASGDICARLSVIEEHPWPELRDGKPITARQLARLLEPLEIRPRQYRAGETIVRGYDLEDFTDGFSRYLADGSDASGISGVSSISDTLDISDIQCAEHSDLDRPYLDRPVSCGEAASAVSVSNVAVSDSCGSVAPCGSSGATDRVTDAETVCNGYVTGENPRKPASIAVCNTVTDKSG